MLKNDSIYSIYIYIYRSKPTISSDNGKNGNQFGEMYIDIPYEIFVKNIMAEEEEEEKEEESEVTNLVANRESGFRIDVTQRYFLF